MSKAIPFQQQADEEDEILKKFRKDNFTKYEALERRTLGNSPTSPISITSSPASTSNSASPINISTCSFQFPPTPLEFNSVFNLPAPDHILKPNTNTTVPPAAVLPGTSTSNQTLGEYPLKGELNALRELTDSVRKDLIQTSMLANHIHDYLKCLNLPAPGYTATPNTNTTVPPPAVLPGTSTSNQTLGKYPLKGELNALCELTDSVRVDLLQTSILVHYIQDYNRIRVCLRQSHRGKSSDIDLGNKWVTPDGFMGWVTPDSFMGWVTPDSFMGWVTPDGFMRWVTPDGFIGWVTPDGFMGWAVTSL
ncbi:uncharacterized protein LOC133180114 [Saccostrea echinata]|uniref:uncharacterized protein LOC133180114 n=1 Tax=Saccostrea echinata TaxID=191078 RepID=UPI002A7F749B|nr:uncharacterized protein LOC133180114 [Saccostrea echinata]